MILGIIVEYLTDHLSLLERDGPRDLTNDTTALSTLMNVISFLYRNGNTIQLLPDFYKTYGRRNRTVLIVIGVMFGFLSILSDQQGKMYMENVIYYDSCEM